MGRFVTRRRRPVTAKSKHPNVSFSLFNSSGDSASGALGSSRVLRPRRRKGPPAFVPSDSDSEILSEISSFPPTTLKEIPINVLPDYTLGPRPRKPVFCSTPSAGPSPKQPGLGSMAVSQKLHLSFGEQETSGDLFVKVNISNMTRSCRERGTENSVTEDQMGEGSLGGNLFSSGSLESNSQCLSATGDRGQLVKALKERCLHVPCTVQLSRSYNPTVSQLCSQTTYSSCLGHPRKGDSCQISEAFNLHLSVGGDHTGASGLSADPQSVLASPSEEPQGQSASAQCVQTSSSATREQKRSTLTERSGTVRKACVSGLSGNRWKNKDSRTHTFKKPTADGRRSRAVDSSMSEMISATSRKQNNPMKVRHTHTHT